ncbi:Serine/threonine-protein kinase NIM1 [Folsomia candida]|uniref:non-specific serine/threonine protein kinase n=2 Tax=Folsomia candida TaxID=158441 RepID=A0A226CWD5_FOLCA|nr:Serine/threonine-protein kinase NIM1 [Folsomia candida]
MMERRRSLRAATKGHPLFTQRYVPPIHTLNSSGESTGGSSEGSMDLCSTSLAAATTVATVVTPPPVTTPFGYILHAMEHDAKWRQERGVGRAVGMYRIHGEIGTGNFARVRLGVHQLLKERVAVKIVDKARVEPKLEKMWNREVATLDSLHHPNIMRLYEVLETPWKLYLISEWAPAGDLYAKVTLRGRLTERETRPIFTQILSALTFMHGNGVVHRDLKAENIFFSTSTHCKVGDFGFATMCHKGQLLSTFCGSPPYAAPELFRDDHYEGAPVDIWALGVLLYFMLEGCLPFVANSIPSLKAAILTGVYELSPGTSDDGTSLLAGILQQRPRSRFTLSTILRHGWLRHIRRQDTTALLLPAITNRALSTQLPTHSQVSNRLLSAPEMSALNALTSLGVAPTSLDQYRAQGVRSAVGGVYRILLHKYQQGLPISETLFQQVATSPTGKKGGKKLHDADEFDVDGSSEKPPQGLHVPTTSRLLRKQVAYDDVQHSTTCVIL